MDESCFPSCSIGRDLYYILWCLTGEQNSQRPGSVKTSFFISMKEENVMLTFETKPTSNALLYAPCSVFIVIQIKESCQQYITYIITYIYSKLCLVPLCCFETDILCYFDCIFSHFFFFSSNCFLELYASGYFLK